MDSALDALQALHSSIDAATKTRVKEKVLDLQDNPAGLSVVTAELRELFRNETRAHRALGRAADAIARLAD